MNQTKLAIAFAAISCLAWGSASAAGNDVKEGEWDIEITLQVEGSNEQQTSHLKTCLGGAAGNKFVLSENAVNKFGDGCKVIKQEQKGEQLTVAMRCEKEKGLSIYMAQTGIYSGTSMDIAQKTITRINGKSTTTKQHIAGERTGPCTKR